jgi:hypothetical protein
MTKEEYIDLLWKHGDCNVHSVVGTEKDSNGITRIKLLWLLYDNRYYLWSHMMCDLCTDGIIYILFVHVILFVILFI